MSNPVFDMLESNDILTMLVLGLLITIWAPVVEEGIMRRSVPPPAEPIRVRDLRDRSCDALSLHQYDVLMFCRSWPRRVVRVHPRMAGLAHRCITAHAIHNTTIFMLVAWLISAT